MAQFLLTSKRKNWQYFNIRMIVKNKILIETTNNWKCDYNVPCHSYEIDAKGNLVAYQIEGTDDWIEFKTKLPFKKTGRTFIEVKK